MKRYLLFGGVIVGLAAIFMVIIFKGRGVESPRTHQGEVMEKIMYIVAISRNYVETKHLTSLGATFKEQFLSDKDTINALSSASLSIVNGKIIDKTSTIYDLEGSPPAYLLVTASDGQKFKADFSP